MLVDLDISILRVFNQMFLPYLNFLFVLIDHSVYLCLLLLIYYLFKKKQKRSLVSLFLTLIIGTLFVLSLKYSIMRARPYEAYPDIKKIGQLIKSDPSFPSFHAFISFLIIHFIPKKQKWLRHFSIVYLLILIPFSSMYMGTHYPSDVLAGAILGWVLPILISKKLSYKLTKKILNF